MDWSAAIEQNREALKRVLAMLVAMAGLGGGAAFTSPLWGSEGRVRQAAHPESEASGGGCAQAITPTRQSDDCRPPHKGEVKPGFSATLPRHLHRAVLRLLRPAEAAARRLVIAFASGLVVPPPRPRKAKPKPATVEPLLRRFGIAVVMSPADLARTSILPRLRRRGTVLSLSKGGGGDGVEPQPSASRILSPELVEGPKGSLPKASLPLLDPLRPLSLSKGRRYVPAHAAPRILFPGVIEPFSLPRPPSPNDQIDAARLGLRLAALAAALDDLPGQAKRFARWKAARDAAGTQNKNHDDEGARKRPAPGRIRRISPLRSGRPPGGRLSRYDPTATHPRGIREVDEILAHSHALAMYALQRRDTS